MKMCIHVCFLYECPYVCCVHLWTCVKQMQVPRHSTSCHISAVRAPVVRGGRVGLAGAVEGDVVACFHAHQLPPEPEDGRVCTKEEASSL